MLRLLALPGAERLHLASWAGSGRWRPLCPYLRDCGSDGDSWPQLREDDVSWGRGGGRLFNGWWLHQIGEPPPEGVPPWPLCRVCEDRWRSDVVAIEALLAR